MENELKNNEEAVKEIIKNFAAHLRGSHEELKYQIAFLRRLNQTYKKGFLDGYYKAFSENCQDVYILDKEEFLNHKYLEHLVKLSNEEGE